MAKNDKFMDRRQFLQITGAGAVSIAITNNKATAMAPNTNKNDKPNILFIMTDQQRFDTIAALGNKDIYTPNLDRLVKRGMSFTNAYSTCPVCIPARYTIRTGCEPPKTRIFSNQKSKPVKGQAETIEGRCGKYLPRIMRQRGYRTFGIGKFHTWPWDEDLGYDTHLHSQGLYGSPERRKKDSYALWIAQKHNKFDFIEMLMGERTEMYYMPQMSPLPAEFTVESWAADRAIELINKSNDKPYFGFVSFFGPHPPCAPPIPFNRMYDPDRMPEPIQTDKKNDHMDEHITWMNYAIWADELNDYHAKVFRSRYYGEITYIDDCIGKILDAVEAKGNSDNTAICFFADHGEHLGDHNAWQKESFFEAACHIPFLVSWPKKIPANKKCDELVCLTDLFAIATGASGEVEKRDGTDLLGVIEGKVKPRKHLTGYYGRPGTERFKIMVRHGDWKYIYLANGNQEQLFNVTKDPKESVLMNKQKPEILAQMRAKAIKAVKVEGASDALDGDKFKAFAFTQRPLKRIYQLDRSHGVKGFPEKPEDALYEFRKQIKKR
ncbi:MAG: sulfatase family protein [Planctomycetota bacterium]|jgi:choline-sulfatase